MKLTGKKFLLILLYSPIKANDFNIPIIGRTRLMKMGFLFEKEILADFKKNNEFEEIELPEFFAWKYGPFSKDLLNDLEFLINQGYVDVTSSESSPLPAELEEYEYWIDDWDDFQSKEYEQEIFKLTEEKGIIKAAEIWNILTENQVKLLREFKRVLNSALLDRIIDYVYKKYEKDGYTDKSLIREKYLSK